MIMNQSSEIQEIVENTFQHPINEILDKPQHAHYFIEGLSNERATELSMTLRLLICEVF